MLSNFQAFIVAGGHGLYYTSSVLTLLPGASTWTNLASLPQPLNDVHASIVGSKMRLTGGFDGSSYKYEASISKWINFLVNGKMFLTMFAFQVLEYQPEPSNQWTTVGQLERKRRSHWVLSITPELLPCLEGCLVKFTNKGDLDLS